MRNGSRLNQYRQKGEECVNKMAIWSQKVEEDEEEEEEEGEEEEEEVEEKGVRKRKG